MEKYQNQSPIQFSPLLSKLIIKLEEEYVDEKLKAQIAQDSTLILALNVCCIISAASLKILAASWHTFSPLTLQSSKEDSFFTPTNYFSKNKSYHSMLKKFFWFSIIYRIKFRLLTMARNALHGMFWAFLSSHLSIPLCFLSSSFAELLSVS